MTDSPSRRGSATLRLLLAMIPAVVTAVALTGCSENCGDVACAPAPPMLVITVLDSVDLGDTILYQRPDDAVVMLYADAGASIQNPIPLELNPMDTTYARYTTLQEGVEVFAVVAERGEKRDTLRNLELKKSDGCCVVTTIGWFTVRL